MTVPVYTDGLNTALDALMAKLTAITGMVSTNDPGSITSPCAFVDAPSWTTYSNGVVELTFPVKLLTLGPGNLDAQRNLTHLASLVLAANIGCTAGRPTTAIIGGSELAAYDLTIETKAVA